MRPEPVPRLLVAGGTILGVLCAVALLAPVLAPYDPHALVGGRLEPPSGRHLLGTDDIGRDILSGLMWGARSSIPLAFAVGSLALVLGTLVGAGAASAGGWVDAAIARLLDIALALPGIPLLVLVGALAGPHRLVLVGVMVFLFWPPVARLVRSQTLTLRQRGYVGAAHGFGASVAYVVWRHLAPAIGPLLVARFVQIAGAAVLLDAGLAFLGVGDTTATSWGLALNRALGHPGLFFTDAWLWWVLPPAAAVTVAVLGFTFVGVGLEGRFNPRLRR